MIKDIVELLQRWDVWKRVEAAPARLDALERRVAALEAARQTANHSAPGADCPRCGAATHRLEKSELTQGPLKALGVRDLHYRCSACGFTETKLED